MRWASSAQDRHGSPDGLDPVACHAQRRVHNAVETRRSPASAFLLWVAVLATAPLRAPKSSAMADGRDAPGHAMMNDVTISRTAGCVLMAPGGIRVVNERTDVVHVERLAEDAIGAECERVAGKLRGSIRGHQHDGGVWQRLADCGE